MPGNMGYQQCQKFAEFAQKIEKHTNTTVCPQHFCGKNSTEKVLSGDMRRCSVGTAMGHLYYAGLSENYAYPPYSNDNDAPAYSWGKRYETLFVAGSTEGGFGSKIGYFPRSSYDSNTYIQPMGWHTERWAEHGGYKNFSGYIFCGSNTYKNSTLPHEFQNANYLSYLNHHTTLTLLRQPIINIDPIMPNQSALSAKMSSELDAKLDDGRPGTGRILAMKGGRAHAQNASESQHLANCYDKMADQVDKAIYHSSTNLEDGCNITYIMSDVK